MMKQKVESYSSYVNSPEFLEFLSCQFDLTAGNATAEELAEFAFGDMKAALRAYKERRKLEKNKKSL